MNAHKRIRRPLGLCLALLAATAAIAAMLWSREQLRILGGEATISLSEEAYDIHPGSDRFYAASEHTFGVVSDSGWQLFDAEGLPIAESTEQLAAPALDVSQEVSVFYSVGSCSLQLAYSDGRVETLTTDEPLRFADVNEKGQLAVITDREGYKGSVTVYNRQLQPLFCWDAGSDFPVCVRLSPKGRVAIGCLTEEGSRLLVFRTDREEPLYERKDEGERILDMAFSKEDRLALLTDSEMLLCHPDRGVLGSVGTEGAYPALFDASETMTVMVTTPERYGGSGTAAALNAAGKTLGSLALPGEILDLSLYKNHILLLTQGELILCSQRMEAIASLSVDQGTDYIFLRPGGTALTAGARGVALYDFGR